MINPAEAIIAWLTGPVDPQPFLLPPKVWETAEEWELLRKEGDKFFIGRHWVMKTEYMPVDGT
jgi:hypothetical protein